MLFFKFYRIYIIMIMVYLLEWKRIFFVVWDEENEVIKSIILWFGFKFFIEKYLILDMILLFDRDGERWFIYFKDFFDIVIKR